MKVTVHWFRRDLRLDDNTALTHALRSGYPVQAVFIFDDRILEGLPDDDPRVSFIYGCLEDIHRQLHKHGGALHVVRGRPEEVWAALLNTYEIAGVYFNKDYEPYALQRDRQVTDILKQRGIGVHTFKDQVIFEENEVIKSDGSPYKIFTAYKNKWLEQFMHHDIGCDSAPPNYNRLQLNFPGREEVGLKKSNVHVAACDIDGLLDYAALRDFPSRHVTSRLGPHLRFGTVSIRWLVARVRNISEVFLSELIWREFFMQILFHFPHVVHSCFNAQYDRVKWRNNETEFEKWCEGKTGYPLVDAGMRELNETGYMHNRVRMVTAGFLCKHLLVDWRWGEAYFARKLLDYELASNNGNWQWAAGTGCDAAPYFRVFNPETQQKKFDKDLLYIKRWLPEFETPEYPKPIVEHTSARARVMDAFALTRQ
ncbi:MAG: deoxyribodipyrimidine photo-lyase [Flavobacteriales bacterium]|nr:deoxyribodipyrimidine photo-lyase [Flavobacteriales bacterium]